MFYIGDQVICKQRQFYVSPPTCILCISFPCVTALAKSSNMMLSTRGQKGNSCLASDLSGKALSFSLLHMTLAVNSLYISFIKLREFLSFWVALMIKHPPANVDVRDTDLIPGLGRSPGEGHGNPLQCSCLENPMDRGASWATVHGVAESDMA